MFEKVVEKLKSATGEGSISIRSWKTVSVAQPIGEIISTETSKIPSFK